jgi:DNA-binding transcriptional MerR regulator
MMTQISNIYLLKDLSRLSGHSIHTLKFYLKLGLIKETGRSPQTRFRYFDDATVEQLAKIRAWRKEKNSLAQIQQLLNTTGGSTPPAPAVE